MKKALLHSIEPGRICEIRNVGEEFEVSTAFSWVDVPDDTTTVDTYDLETNTVIKFDIVNQPGFIEDGYKVARTIGYGSIGNQLDMLYKEIKANGTISASGPWASHIASVKAAIPKDDPQAVHEWNQAYYAELEAQQNNSFTVMSGNV
jgi:hypothetical protein